MQSPGTSIRYPGRMPQDLTLCSFKVDETETDTKICPSRLQLGRIYLDMLNVYKVMSENVSSAIATNGENVTKQPLIKSMRTVKKETLKLISGWVSRSNDSAMVSVTCIKYFN